MMSFQKLITLVALMAFASHGAIAAPAGVESAVDALGKALDTVVGYTTPGDPENAGIKSAGSTLGNEKNVGPREEDEDDEDDAKCKGKKGKKGKKDVIPREEDEEDAKCKGKGKKKSDKGKKDIIP